MDSSKVADGSLTESDMDASVLTASGAAQVDRDGTLIRGKNVTSVQRTGKGAYEVTFNSAVDISTAYLVASPGVNTTCAAIESVEPGSSGNYAFVLFVTESGNRVNCGFSLLAF